MFPLQLPARQLKYGGGGGKRLSRYHEYLDESTSVHGTNENRTLLLASAEFLGALYLNLPLGLFDFVDPSVPHVYAAAWPNAEATLVGMGTDSRRTKG